MNAATAIAWVVWPLFYCVYILLRASFSGFYPYPFLNLPELGTGALAMNIAGLLVAFVLIGTLLTLISKFVGRRL